MLGFCSHRNWIWNDYGFLSGVHLLQHDHRLVPSLHVSVLQKRRTVENMWQYMEHSSLSVSRKVTPRINIGLFCLFVCLFVLIVFRFCGCLIFVVMIDTCHKKESLHIIPTQIAWAFFIRALFWITYSSNFENLFAHLLFSSWQSNGKKYLIELHRSRPRRWLQEYQPIWRIL